VKIEHSLSYQLRRYKQSIKRLSEPPRPPKVTKEGGHTTIEMYGSRSMKTLANSNEKAHSREGVGLSCSMFWNMERLTP
jgi:hypothetical protein